MRGVIVVETQKEYNDWMIKAAAGIPQSKAGIPAETATDSTKTVALRTRSPIIICLRAFKKYQYE